MCTTPWKKSGRLVRHSFVCVHKNMCDRIVQRHMNWDKNSLSEGIYHPINNSLEMYHCVHVQHLYVAFVLLCLKNKKKNPSTQQFVYIFCKMANIFLP